MDRRTSFLILSLDQPLILHCHCCHRFQSLLLDFWQSTAAVGVWRGGKQYDHDECLWPAVSLGSTAESLWPACSGSKHTCLRTDFAAAESFRSITATATAATAAFGIWPAFPGRIRIR